MDEQMHGWVEVDSDGIPTRCFYCGELFAWDNLTWSNIITIDGRSVGAHDICIKHHEESLNEAYMQMDD